MNYSEHSERQIVRKLSLHDESVSNEIVGDSPAERLNMMWQIAQDCWSFMPGQDAKQEFQRHVARIQRGGR